MERVTRNALGMPIRSSMGVELDWGKLRKHHGSLHASFEQLCAILAEHEGPPNGEEGWRFIRNGRPDGGVECYWESRSGEVHGYQAKYHRETLASSQWNQLDASLEQLLKKYSTLTVVTVCLPIDLPHSRTGKGATAREKWHTWQNKWRVRAQREGRVLELRLWGEHQITAHLIKHRAAFRFFFDSRMLNGDDLRSAINEQVKRAGPRYQPQLHIGLDLDAVADWLTAPPQLRLSLRDAAQIARKRAAAPELQEVTHGLKDWAMSASRLTEALFAIERIVDTSDVRDLAPAAEAVANALGDIRNATASLHVGSNRSPSELDTAATDNSNRWHRAATLVRAIEEAAHPITHALNRGWAQALDKRVVLLSGSGGCGKTHLLCDMATRLAANDQPAVLVFGNQLNVRTLWRDVYARTGAFEDQRAFFESLNAAGQMAGCRSLLLIDGLNEAEGNSAWSGELRAMLSNVAEYPYVSVILTVRDSYLDLVWPRQSSPDDLARFVHPGFGDNTDDAVARYCEHYNIAHPDVSCLRPEFNNGLFLSMFCQAVAGAPDPHHRRLPMAFPGGLQSFSEVFDAFIARREMELVERFDLDRDFTNRPLAAAVDALVDRMAKSASLEVSIGDCKRILQRHLRSHKLDGNIVGLLESEGLLLRVPHVSQRGTIKSERIQFAFDRLASHLVVKRWLSGYSTASQATALFRASGAFALFAGREMSRGHVMSVCESLIQQWPERFGVELFDSRPDLLKKHAWCDTFLRALRSSSPCQYSAHTSRYLIACLDAFGERKLGCSGHVQELFGRIGNPDLIECLHGYMHSQSLAERDSWWTTGLGDGLYTQRADGLTSWPRRTQIGALPNAIALSYVTALAWLTTSTAIELRARATKAVAAVLEHNLHAAGPLLSRFRLVNDPYVLQSVCNAIYGACLRSTNAEAVRQVANQVMSLWPTKRSWPVDLWVRHSLCSIVELAKHRLPEWPVNLAAVRPPYSSKWIGTIPSWQSIERDLEALTKQEYRGWSSVVSSCYPESEGTGGPRRMYGDFGRYVVSSACHSFFPAHSAVRHLRLQPPFRYDVPHRFIIKRVRQIGWTEERFERFDRSAFRGTRMENEVERIGKKYQWIALSEFLARASDRFPLHGPSWSDQPCATLYQYPRQLIRHGYIDTSLLRVREQVRRDPSTTDWWSRRNGEGLWDSELGDEWLLSASGVPDPKQFLIQTEPGDTRRWSLLQGYLNWHEYDPQDVTERPTSRRIFLHIHAICVRSRDLSTVRAWMQELTPHGERPPEPQHLSDSLFGELYWSRAALLEAQSPWQRFTGGPDDRSRAVLPLAAQYLNESDPTFGTSLYALVPCKWLVDAMGLRAGPAELAFCDVTGNRVSWNPSVLNGGADAVFCDSDKLSTVAKENRLRIAWCVFGEKNIIGDGWRVDGPFWPFVKGFYWLERGELKGGYDVVLDDEYRTGQPRAMRTASRAATPIDGTELPTRLLRQWAKRQNQKKKLAREALRAGSPRIEALRSSKAQGRSGKATGQSECGLRVGRAAPHSPIPRPADINKRPHKQGKSPT